MRFPTIAEHNAALAETLKYPRGGPSQKEEAITYFDDLVRTAAMEEIRLEEEERARLFNLTKDDTNH